MVQKWWVLKFNDRIHCTFRCTHIFQFGSANRNKSKHFKLVDFILDVSYSFVIADERRSNYKKKIHELCRHPSVAFNELQIVFMSRGILQLAYSYH